MLSRQHHCRGAKDRVDPGGEHANPFIVIFDFEIYERAHTASDPIALALNHFFRPT